MTDSGGLQHSLSAMGFVELALAFCCLTGYSLLLSGVLAARARWVAGAIALTAAAGFAALADPWTHGVILVALGIGGIGVFVVAAWGLSAACGLTRRSVREPEAAAELPGARAVEADGAASEAARPAPGVRPRPGPPAHQG